MSARRSRSLRQRAAPCAVVSALGAIFIGAPVACTGGESRLAPAPLSVLHALGPAPDDARYARAIGPREFRFPEDHGPHSAFRSEWWYWTGNLDGPAGRRFGYQFTVFRNALAPESSERRTSAWATRQFFMAHFALTDVTSGAFYAFERTSRAALGLAGATADPFRVWLLDWRAAGSPQRPGKSRDDAGPVDADGVELQVAMDGVALDLALAAGKPTVLEGEHGLSQKGSAPGNASYYYSRTRMPTTGSVTVRGPAIPVQGDSWMDREWSTSALESGQTGWDWFSLQLSDGRDLMFYRLRDRAGAAHAMSSGTLVDADGRSRHLTREEVSVQALGAWKSPRSGVVYPAGFHLRVAPAALDLVVTPAVADQELNVTFRYWEGAVTVSGDAGTAKVTGRGYMELTGYGEEASERASP
jgi:predicted secreted hydrolase